MSLKLRDLIRQVRACKTAAEERAVIAKESAMIRTDIREEKEQHRHRNVAKLLFMHMLGYPTHFGQLECMKLVASPNFPEKRIGYLGMMLLLSEQADILMLATNSLKNDLNNADNRFIVGLALCAIGNLATADMSRDLIPEVDKHLTNNKPYLRKKACLAMSRCLTKCPEMIDDFVDRVVGLLNDRTHGVLITVLQLMTRVLVMDMEYQDGEGGGDGGTTTDVVSTTSSSSCRNAFLKLVPALVKLLRNLLSMGYSPEHDVGGISDPFLQVQILTLLRLLGMNNVKASEDMNDVLAQVATNTETSKNAGNAILYECVLTIMAIESDDGLRVLAVNILGRFLLNRDNNIRYVALNTLARCIITDGGKGSNGSSGDDVAIVDGSEVNGGGKGGANTAASALQRHRTTVVDCLRDPDISIRQRALELIYHLVNRDNVEALTAELLNYLVLCPREHRSDICTRILRVVDKYSPDDRWRVDTLVTMLTIAGRECNSNVQSSTSVYISRSTEDLRAYSTHRLLKAVRDDDGSQRGLLNVGIWCIGEYGDLLLRGYSYNPPPPTTMSKGGLGGAGEDGLLSTATTTVSFEALEPCAIVDIVKAVMDRTTIQEETKERTLTCFAKLRERFADTADAVTLTRLQTLVEKYEGSHSLELQLRSIEYGRLLNAIKGVSVKRAPVNKVDQEEDLFGVGGDGAGSSSEIVSETVKTAAKEALARMPVVDVKLMQRKREERAGALRMSIMDDPFGSENGSAIATGTASSSGGGDLLDLEDIFGGGAPSTVVPTVVKTNGITKVVAAANHASTPSDADLLSDIFSMPPAPSASPNVGGGFDMFSSPSVGASMTPPVPAFGTNFDMFGATPQPPVSSPFSPTPSMSSAASGGFDVFGATATPGNMMSLPAPASLQTSMASSISGTVPLQSSTTSSTIMSSGGSSVGSSSVSTTTEFVGVTVPGFTHEGLTVEFVCTKPDAWNKQNSVLVAKFINTTDAPLYGLHLQVAVPKYVTMEMKPPTSTTVPVTVTAAGGQQQQQQTKGLVTQTISVTNTMLGTKNLMLKVKASFTSKGTKVEHTTTCSGFPAGQY